MPVLCTCSQKTHFYPLCAKKVDSKVSPILFSSLLFSNFFEKKLASLKLTAAQRHDFSSSSQTVHAWTPPVHSSSGQLGLLSLADGLGSSLSAAAAPTERERQAQNALRKRSIFNSLFSAVPAGRPNSPPIK